MHYEERWNRRQEGSEKQPDVNSLCCHLWPRWYPSKCCHQWSMILQKQRSRSISKIHVGTKDLVDVPNLGCHPGAMLCLRAAQSWPSPWPGQHGRAGPEGIKGELALSRMSRRLDIQGSYSEEHLHERNWWRNPKSLRKWSEHWAVLSQMMSGRDAGFRLPRLHEISGRLGKAKDESTRQSHLGEAASPWNILSQYPCHTHSLARRSC